ncbi:MAG: translocation/assembly module TamB [Chitinophagales bacterium]|nr:translocation/assembly module TamB [Chitinophagales bacterium]
MKVALNERSWNSGKDSASVIISSDSVHIEDFKISSSESMISANGFYTLNGKQDLKIQVGNIRLESIPGTSLLPYAVKGNLKTDLDLKGTATDPILNGRLSVDDLLIDTFEIGSFTSSVVYQDELFSSEFFLNDVAKEIISAKINIPGNLSLKENQFDIYEDSTIYALVKMDQFDSRKVSRFLDLSGMSYQGLLYVNIEAGNTLNDPAIDGKILLSEGGFKYPQYGIDYKNITMDSRIDNSNYYLDDLSISSGKGNIDLKGIAEIRSWLEGEVQSLDFTLTSENFMALNNQGIQAIIDSDLKLRGTPEKPNVNGEVTIVRSMINTDVLASEYGGVSDNAQEPLLVRARKEQIRESGELLTDTLRNAPPSIIKNLKAEVKIDIPRNTWVKGKNMNFELSGSVRLIQEGEQMDLFGAVSIKRGFYKIYGKKLEFEEGVITFTGGKINNPLLNFSIAYKFRDNQQRLRKLTVNVSGRLEKPEMLYAIDGTSISEKEAISYLLFKKDMNQLDSEENASVENSELEMAKSLAINQLTGALQDKLQSALRLDAIEITGEKNWKQAKASIGKYITNKLYLSYEQSFALNKKDKAINPYKVGLEYQFLPWLYFQGTNQSSNSGFDLIMKWSWR